MNRCLPTSLLTATCLGLAAAPADLRASEPPSVVASIPPVGAIAAAIMDGVGTPAVLLEPGASPHATSLRPSQAEALSGAELILWIGPEFEIFLDRPLAALGGDASQLALADAADVELLPFREGATFEAHEHDEHDDHGHDEHAEAEHDHDHDHEEHAEAEHDHDHDHEEHAEDEHDHDHGHEEHAEDEHDHAHDDHADHDHHDHAHGEFDLHIWLSPANAREMAAAIAAELAALDGDNADHYAANLAQFDARLDGVEGEIDGILEPVRGQPFIVFHDAYQYFEDHFDIEATGAVHVVPDVPPSASRVAEIRERIDGAEAVCVFAEPQFEPRLVETLIEGTEARSGVLDPLGGDVELGPDGYPDLLLQLARNLDDCLAG